MADSTATQADVVASIINAVVVVIMLPSVPVMIYITNKRVEEAPKDVIRKKRVMKKFYHTNEAHPDFGGDTKEFKKFKEKYKLKKKPKTKEVKVKKKKTKTKDKKS